MRPVYLRLNNITVVEIQWLLFSMQKLILYQGRHSKQRCFDCSKIALGSHGQLLKHSRCVKGQDCITWSSFQHTIPLQ